MSIVSHHMFIAELRRRRVLSDVQQQNLVAALIAGKSRSDFNHSAFMTALRQMWGKVPTAIYDDIMVALNVAMANGVPSTSGAIEPDWITEGRKHVGLREIVGTKHNPMIVKFWKVLGRPYKEDETPWCGGFVGYCIASAGLRLPSIPERAASWATWGKATPAIPGAVGVKSRKGGNHVFFIIGETVDGRYYKVLEGNANNMVRIGDILKTDVHAIRWPNEQALALYSLPRLAPGVTSRSEA